MTQRSDARLGVIQRVARKLAAATQPEGISSVGVLLHAGRWRAAVGEAVSLLALEERGCHSSGVGPRRHKCNTLGEVLESREFTPAGRVVCNGNCGQIGDVLDMSAPQRQALRAFVEEFPEELDSMVAALHFRQMVGTAVEALRELEVAA